MESDSTLSNEIKQQQNDSDINQNSYKSNKKSKKQKRKQKYDSDEENQNIPEKEEKKNQNEENSQKKQKKRKGKNRQQVVNEPEENPKKNKKKSKKQKRKEREQQKANEKENESENENENEEQSNEEDQEDPNVLDFDDPESLESFLGKATKESIEEVAEYSADGLYKLIKHKTGSLDIFKSDKVHQHCSDLLQRDFSLYKKILNIFPDDSELKEEIIGIASDLIEQGEEVDGDIFNMLDISDQLVEQFVFSKGFDDIDENHPLVNQSVDFINKNMDNFDLLDLADAASILVEQAGIDVSVFKYKYKEYPEFYMRLWEVLGFEKIDEIEFCQLLDYFIVSKMKWIDAYMYTRKIDWNSIPSSIGSYIKVNPNLFETAAENSFLYALTYIIHATERKVKSDDSLIIRASLSAPPKKLKSIDPDIIDLQIEWHQIRIPTPNFASEADIHSLKRTLVYLKQNIPVLSTFDPIIPFIVNALSNKNVSRISFFIVLNILSLIADAAKDYLNLAEILNLLIPLITQYSPFPTVIREELESALRLFNLMEKDEFCSVVLNNLNEFTGPQTNHITKIFLPMFSHFDIWDDIVSLKIGDKLDLTNGNTWIFLNYCLQEMPLHSREKIITIIKDDINKSLTSMDYNSIEFEETLYSLPVYANKWFTMMDKASQTELRNFIISHSSQHIFKKLTNSILKYHIDQIKFNINKKYSKISVSYKEDQFTGSLTLTISIPKDYPLSLPTFEVNFGREDKEKESQQLVENTFHLSQSIDQSIMSWVSFVINMVEDSSPCIVCFAYINNGSIPSKMCSHCNQRFHESCLKQWFSHHKNKTCPYCNLKWVEK